MLWCSEINDNSVTIISWSARLNTQGMPQYLVYIIELTLIYLSCVFFHDLFLWIAFYVLGLPGIDFFHVALFLSLIHI